MTVTIENNYTGNGSLKTYSFTFPYLDNSDVKVSLGGNDTTNFNLSTTSITFTADSGGATSTQEADGAPKSSVAIRIYRSTSYDSPKATFYPGSAIRANDLNDNSLQNLYVTQEANVEILDSWKKGDPTIISSETWASNNTQIATTGSIDGRIDAKANTKLTDDLIGGDDITIADNNNAGSSATGKFTINHSVTGAASVDNSNGTVIQDLTINGRGHVTATGSVDLDNRYYTKTIADDTFFNVSTGDTIKDGDAFPDNDTTIATTAAINDRIIDLVDDVGGFVPIANETSFPTANPDVNNGTGTLVSIKALASNLTSNGSGVATITNGAGSGNNVTISGLANSTTYAATFGMIVETTATSGNGSATPPREYTFHRQTPKATEVTTVAGSISNVNTVATNISAITTVNDNISNINTVNSNSTNINAVAGQISFSEDLGAITDSVSTGSGTNITTVASSIADVNRYANEYKIADSAPGSPSAGDLWYDGTNEVLKYYNGSAFTGITPGLTDVVNDTTPELGGHLDCNDKNLTEVATVSGDNLQIDFGSIA